MGHLQPTAVDATMNELLFWISTVYIVRHKVFKCLMGRIVKTLTKWAGHVERMNEDCLPRKAHIHREKGRRSGGRPCLIWQDVTERAIRSLRIELEVEAWRAVARDRGQWRRVVSRAARMCRHPHH